tara:strand:- start:3217 stop:3666 length:450 start_codon:yes stop_codon:yes gene_type:complete
MNYLNEIKHKLYGESIQVPLSEEELISVCLSFPGALVAACDGDFDDAERLVMLDVSEVLCNGNIAEDSSARLKSAEIYRAFMWLLDNKAELEDLIFSGLKEFLKDNNETSQQITEMLYEVADVTDGISEVEQKEIDRITSLLDISNSIN